MKTGLERARSKNATSGKRMASLSVVKHCLCFLLTETHTEGKGLNGRSENVLLVRAANKQPAREKSVAYGRNLETSYRNQYGQEISVRFSQRITITDALREGFAGDGIWEFGSRSFRDGQTYERLFGDGAAD